MKKALLIFAAIMLPLAVLAEAGIYITGDMGYGAVLNAVNTGYTAGKMRGSLEFSITAGPVNAGIKISPAYYTLITPDYNYYNFILPVLAVAELPVTADEKWGVSIGFGIGPAYIKATKNYAGLFDMVLIPAAYDGMGMQAELAMRYYKIMDERFTFLAGVTCEWLYADKVKAYDLGIVESTGGFLRYNDRSLIFTLAFKYGF